MARLPPPGSTGRGRGAPKQRWQRVGAGGDQPAPPPPPPRRQGDNSWTDNSGWDDNGDGWGASSWGQADWWSEGYTNSSEKPRGGQAKGAGRGRADRFKETVDAEANKAFSESYQRKVAIPRHLIGMFVGKGGVSIKNICAEAECAAHVNDAGEDDGSAQVVIGAPEEALENVEKAVKMVEDRITMLQAVLADDKEHLPQAVRQVVIPNHLVGQFVGKGGVAIKDIMAKSGCSAYVDDQSSEGGATYVVVGRRSDTSDCIDIAAAMVEKRIALIQSYERKERQRSAGSLLARRVTIPRHLVGQFVGKQGACIKQICSRAGCHAHVDDEHEKEDEAVVVVGSSGDTQESINAGVEMVEKRIAELLDAANLIAQAGDASGAAGGNGPRGDVQAEIRMMLAEGDKISSPLVLADFDFKVLLFLRSLVERRGREGLRGVLDQLLQALGGRGRESVRSWPAYTLTLLRKIDFKYDDPPVPPPDSEWTPPLEDYRGAVPPPPAWDGPETWQHEEEYPAHRNTPTPVRGYNGGPIGGGEVERILDGYLAGQDMSRSRAPASPPSAPCTEDIPLPTHIPFGLGRSALRQPPGFFDGGGLQLQ